MFVIRTNLTYFYDSKEALTASKNILQIPVLFTQNFEICIW